MGKEFNLSEKITPFDRDTTGFDHIPMSDVKEFIRLLKEEFTDYDEYDKCSFVSAIDKLAGDELLK